MQFKQVEVLDAKEALIYMPFVHLYKQNGN